MDEEPRVGAGDETVPPADARDGEALEDELTQELAVLHRVFRHDFRNRLNVILGQAEVAKTQTTDDALVEYLDAILAEVRALTQTVDQISLIQTLASSGAPPDVVDIGATLRDLVAEYDDQSAAAFETSIPDSVWVWMNPSSEAAFRELIENAVVHNDAATPRVTVRVTEGDTTEVRIADNGPGMPPGTKASLEATTVDSTDHLTSLGLWTAYWIITRSGGTVSIDDNQPRGCVVTVSLRSATPPEP
ncbi:MAG: sensor histidine kinase [Haloarculaceae archaeon]